MCSSAPPPSPPLRKVLEHAKPSNYHELAMRLLFCTTIVAGDSHYRIREIEMYHADDPYTHQGDEQVSSTGGWYFHRTKPGGGWKGGTFMGLDISFAPIGTAGGVLIRGISRIPQNGQTYQYIDGSCNCVREFLKACGVSKIMDLVEKPSFRWDALNPNGIFHLLEHEPKGVEGAPKNNGNLNTEMKWVASCRIGLSDPNKFPQKARARRMFHLAPLRFLQFPYETKKEVTKIQNAKARPFRSKEEYDGVDKESQDKSIMKRMDWSLKAPPGKQ